MAYSQEQRDPASQESTDVRIRIAFTDLGLTATLYDNPTARDLASMLPLDLKIEDYGKNEKIVYLPRKLTELGGGPFGNERPAIFATSNRGATWPCSTRTTAGTGWSDLAVSTTASTRCWYAASTPSASNASEEGFVARALNSLSSQA